MVKTFVTGLVFCGTSQKVALPVPLALSLCCHPAYLQLFPSQSSKWTRTDHRARAEVTTRGLGGHTHAQVCSLGFLWSGSLARVTVCGHQAARGAEKAEELLESIL